MTKHLFLALYVFTILMFDKRDFFKKNQYFVYLIY